MTTREKDAIEHDDEIARLQAEVETLDGKLNQARGDIKHIRKWEVKPLQAEVEELKETNDRILAEYRIVARTVDWLRERGLLEDK
jgi:FtsZ-binding cell division protein ZapB